jgi:carboxyl-terminal processing protease
MVIPPIRLAAWSQLARKLFGLGCLLMALTNADGAYAQLPQLEFNQGKVFDEVWSLVQQHFYDPKAVEEPWTQARDQFRVRAVAARTHGEFAQVMNELLTTLKVSHTYYFAAPNQRRTQLLGVFEILVPQGREELFFYNSIGIETEQISGKTFIRAVYDGFPAAQSGMLYGDEILSVDGQPFQEIESFRDKQEVQLQVRRSADAVPESYRIPVVRLDGRRMFEEAMLASARTIEHGKQKIAYVHVWSYAGSKYQDQLRNLLLFGKLKDADALILDLRDGWGGASLEYLNLFRESIVDLTSRPRDGEPMNFSGVWGKPVVLLVNQRSTSGKELFTFGFKKLGLGEVVGETTAGAVVAGRGFLLSNQDVLYLAVADIEVDGKRLEGSGVQPDHAIGRPLPYAAGADPQLERALELLANSKPEPDGKKRKASATGS